MNNHRLEGLRTERNLLKKQMVQIIEVTQSVYSECENKKLSIPTKRIYKLAEFLEVNIDYMLEVSNKRIQTKVNKTINTLNLSTRLR